MSHEFLPSSGRPDATTPARDAAWILIGLWAGVATVMGLAAATVEPILALGRGAVVLAAVGAACAVALASAAVMFGAAGALAGWRRFRPVSGPTASAPHPPTPSPTAGNPILQRLVGGLATQLAKLDKKVNAAVGGGAAVEREGSEARPYAARETAASAVDQSTRWQAAIDARIKAEAENSDLRVKTRLNALADAVLPRVNALSDDMARLKRAHAEAGARINQFEQQVFDILRARDVGDTLRRLDAEAADLFDKLFDADERRYAAAGAWQADYASWKSRINTFWDILRGYSTDVEQPFAVTDAEVARAGGLPDNGLFATQDMRFCYQMMIVVNERHMNFREDAFSFNAERSRPPRPEALPSPRQVAASPARTRQSAAPGSLVA